MCLCFFYTGRKKINQFNSMKGTAFSEADSRSAGQEILRNLWDRKVHQHFHKNHLLNHFLGQSNPLRMITSYLFEIHCRTGTYITFPHTHTHTHTHIYIYIYIYSRFIKRNCVFLTRILCAS